MYIYPHLSVVSSSSTHCSPCVSISVPLPGWPAQTACRRELWFSCLQFKQILLVESISQGKVQCCPPSASLVSSSLSFAWLRAGSGGGIHQYGDWRLFCDHFYPDWPRPGEVVSWGEWSSRTSITHHNQPLFTQPSQHSAILSAPTTQFLSQ